MPNSKFSPLLGIWIALGAILRFSRLGSKPPWGDEFSTLVFSLGNSFQTVALDRAIALDTLLQPLQLQNAGVGSVIDHLLRESTHPPLYFVLAHLWMRLFSPDNPVAAMAVARAFSALWGVAAIPAIFALTKLAFRHRLAPHLAAVLMALSPLGLFLAQEARHYTLAIVFVIASLYCLIVATRCLQQQTPIPISIALSWIVVNTLGIATHYFFALALCAEALILAVFWLKEVRSQADKGDIPSPPSPHPPLSLWRRIWVVAFGSLAGGLVWLPVWRSFYGSDLTNWVQNDEPFNQFFDPIGRVGTWLVAMFVQLPVDDEAVSDPIAILSQVGMGVFVLWMLPLLYKGFKGKPSPSLAFQLLGGFVLGAILVFFLLTYGFGKDVTLAPRFSFVYFPAVIAWVAGSLTGLPPRGGLPKSVILMGLVGLASAPTVMWNLGYLEHHRPDRLVAAIQQESPSPIAIATTYHGHHGPIVKMMGLALEFKRQGEVQPQFLLAREMEGFPTATAMLQETLKARSGPMDLWLVNFNAAIDIEGQNCRPNSDSWEKVGRFKYQHYSCGDRSDSTARSAIIQAGTELQQSPRPARTPES